MRKLAATITTVSLGLVVTAAYGQSSFDELSSIPGAPTLSTAAPAFSGFSASTRSGHPISGPATLQRLPAVAVANNVMHPAGPPFIGPPGALAGTIPAAGHPGCGGASTPCPCPGPPVCAPVPLAPCRWFGGVYGLVMTRQRDRDVFVGYDDAYPTTQLLTTRDAAMNYAGGVEAQLGKYLNKCWALQAVYWGIYPSDQTAQLFASDVVGNVDSPLEFDYLEYDNGTGPVPAGSYFDDTQVLRVVRDYEFHNFELNFWRRPLVWHTKACRPVRVSLLGGVRYLRMQELLDVDSDVANNAFGDDLANELFYDMTVKNDLVGFQIGGLLRYCLTNRLAIQAGPKAGIYGNHIRHRQTLWGGNGSAVISSSSPLGYAGSAYSSDSSKNDVAFIGELLVGLDYCLTPCWSLAGGYRAVFVSGVAVPAGQIPHRYDDLAAVDRINSNDCLVLHGAYAGLQYNW